MCNQWCLEFAKKIIPLINYKSRILEVGSRNINGSVRSIIKNKTANYYGVDISEGDGVDEILNVSQLSTRFNKENFNVIVNTEMLEHCQDWKNAIYEMLKVLESNGILILTTRSPGFETHDYPNDFWRFTRKDMKYIFADIGHIIELEDDITLGWPCGIGIIFRKTCEDNTLEKWRGKINSYEVRKVNGVDKNDIPLMKKILFDQYSRYKTCAEILSKICDAGSTILDVGCGENPILGLFLPNAQITFLDPLLINSHPKGINEDQNKGFIAGDIESKELQGRSFDCVVCIDTLEHILPGKRNDFINRLDQLAKKAIILAFPASDAGDALNTDQWVDDVFRSVYDKSHVWLREHFKYGLPTRKETIKKLETMGWDIHVEQNGYTPWLKELLGFTVCALEITELNPVVYELSHYFNKHLYEYDYLEPAYRQIILASKGKIFPPAIRPTLTDDIKKKVIPHWEYLKKNMIASKGLNRLKAELAEKNDLIQSQQKEIEKRDHTILSQNADIQEVSNWAHALEKERNEKIEQIEVLTHELSRAKSLNLESESKILEKQIHIDDINQQLSESLNQLSPFYSSSFFNLFQKIDNYKKSLKKTIKTKYSRKNVNKNVYINFDKFIQINTPKNKRMGRNKNIKKIKPSMETNREITRYNIDEFHYDETSQTLSIRGWGIHLYQNSEGNQIQLVLHSEKGGYAIKATIQSRPDVTAAYKSLNFDESGFSVNTCLNGLKSGKYKIGIIINKKDIKRIKNDNSRNTVITKKPLQSVNYHRLLKEAKINAPSAYDVIFFSIINWDFRIQRPQHLASGFAKKGHRIFYLNVDLTNNSQCSYREISQNIFEIFLPYVKKTSIYVEKIENQLKILEEAFSALIAEFSIKECVAIVEYPMWFPLVKYLKDTHDTVVVFDVLDEFCGFSNAHRDIRQYEDKLAEISDFFTCTSGKIFKRLKLKHTNVKLIPNAAESGFFNILPKNSLLKGLKKPIIGYYGAIAEWFDVELVEYIARSRPDWSILLIGHTFGARLNNLEQLENVYMLGEKPYESLPSYIYWFDVCLIPFKLSDLILSCNPVKFFEYISSGKPVVATDLPELYPFSDIAYLAKNKEEFLENIELALAERDPKKRKKRINIAKYNDWNHRVQKFESIIQVTFPKVSIIIVTFNNRDYCELCLQSILSKTAWPNYEIIIIDNASTDGTRKYLEKLGKTSSKIKIVFNMTNQGFAKANNQGIAIADGQYVILLNSDTIVTRGWMGGLIKSFKDPTVGMVCPVTNNIGNEARINVNYLDINYMDSFAERYTRSHQGESFEINGCAMFCVTLQREVINKIGLLDERFGIGTFEDDDYSFRIKEAGYQLLCLEDVFIHHFGNASFKKLGDGKYQRVMEENLKKFEDKWGFQWQGHQYRDGVFGVPYVMPDTVFEYCYSSYKKQLTYPRPRGLYNAVSLRILAFDNPAGGQTFKKV